MAAISLQKNERYDFAPHAIVGSRNPDGFIFHVGVLASSATVSAGSSVKVIGQEPPITDHNTSCDAVAWFELSDDQLESGNHWIEAISPESRRNQQSRFESYQAYPAIEEPVDPVTGASIKRKFSCIGFVICLYKEGLQAPIPLASDYENFPRISLQEVCLVWEAAKRPIFRKIANLLDEGPWPLVLPAYAFHAMDGREGIFRPVTFEDGKF